MFSWPDIREEIACLMNAGPLGRVALAAFVASALMVILLVGSAVRARRRLGSVWFARIAALVVVTFFVGAAASARLVSDVQRVMLDPPPPRADFAPKFYLAFVDGMPTLHAAWFVFAVALTFVGALSLVGALVRGGPRAPLGSLSALLCASTGASLLYALHVGTLGSFCGDPAMKCVALTALSADSIAVTNLMRLALVAVAVVGSVIVVWFERKNHTQASVEDEEVMLGRGAAVFAFGLAAFFATRGMAYDARYPIPLREKEEAACPQWQGMVSEQEARALPLAGVCDVPCQSGPFVHVTRDGASVDLMQHMTPGWLADVLKDKRRLADQIRGDRAATPFVVMIVAAEDMPARDVEPYVAAAKRAYGGAIAIAGVHPAKRRSTATVGEIELLPRCCCSALRLDATAPPLTSRATWGEVARASQRGEAFSLSSENP